MSDAAGERWPAHGFVPDPLVDHDRPVCELCGEYFEESHSEYAGYVLVTDRERARLEQALAAANERAAEYGTAHEELVHVNQVEYEGLTKRAALVDALEREVASLWALVADAVRWVSNNGQVTAQSDTSPQRAAWLARADALTAQSAAEGCGASQQRA